MTNEEFQKIVLKKLTNLEEKQTGLEEKFSNLEEKFSNLEEKFSNLEEKFSNLEKRQQNLEEGQKIFAKKLDLVYEQTGFLTEFRTETNRKLDSIIEDNKSIYEILGEHEVAIRTLRRRPV
ncbi:MAG: hypothetical protein AB1420_12965 [Bacillota bacterium]